MSRETVLAWLISGTPSPPEWLEPGLKTMVHALAWNIQAEARYPKRADAQSRLTDLMAAVETIATLRKDGDIRDALSGEGLAGLEAIGAAVQSMDAIRPLIENALAALPVRQGRDKHHFTSVVTPLQMCAEAVCVAWNEARGKQASHTSKEAQDACQLLWVFAGGPERQQSSGDPSNTRGWRDRLRDAKAALALSHSDYAQYKHLLQLTTETGASGPTK